MLRRLFTVLSAAPLLLSLAAAMLWARGARDADQFIFTTRGRLWWVISARGSIDVICVRPWPRPERFRWVVDNSIDKIPTVAHTAPPGSESQWRALGMAGENTEVSTWLDEAGTPVSLAEANHPDWRRRDALHESGMMPYRSVSVPLWMPFALGAGVPCVVFARRLRHSRLRRRAAMGLCVRCGYDLRATPGRCTECGVAPAIEVTA